jgi:hypothetical protein
MYRPFAGTAVEAADEGSDDVAFIVVSIDDGVAASGLVAPFEVFADVTDGTDEEVVVTVIVVVSSSSSFVAGAVDAALTVFGGCATGVVALTFFSFTTSNFLGADLVVEASPELILTLASPRNAFGAGLFPSSSPICVRIANLKDWISPLYGVIVLLSQIQISFAT